MAAFPTETYYGLGADPRRPGGLQRVLQLKGRSAADKPLLLLAASLDQLAPWVRNFPPDFDRLTAHFWPGPLTLVLPAATGIPDELVGSGGGVAVRVSSHPLARRLILACGTAITGTSANRAGMPPCADAAAVRAAFGDEIAVVVDGGPARGGQPSTLLDLCGPEPRVLRSGAIREAALRKIVRLV